MSIFSNFPYRLIHTKKFEKKLAKDIDAAVEEALVYKDVNEAEGLPTGSVYNKSIFEVYESLTCSSSKTKEGAVLESEDWVNAGLFLNQDPKNMQTYEKLMLQQQASKWQWINFPIARSIIDNVIRYCLGRGVKVDCPVPEVNQIISNFWRDNTMEARVKNSFRSLLLNGEYYFALFERDPAVDFDKEQDSILVVRKIGSSEIKEIEYDPEDSEVRLSYTRTKILSATESEDKYYLDHSHSYGTEKNVGLSSMPDKSISIHEADAEDGVRVLMVKYGLDDDSRGRVFMETVLRWNRVFMDFMYDRGMLNHFRCKIFMIETRTSKTGRVIGSRSSVEKIPKGGVKLVETGDRKFRFESPNTGSGDAYTDTKSLAYLIGSGVSIPIHILLMNAENENYASIREAGNPFAQMIQDLQDNFGESIKVLIRHLLKVCVLKGLIPNEFKIESYKGDIGEAVDFITDGLIQGVPFDDLMEQTKGIIEKETKIVRVKDLPLNVVFPEIIHTDREKIAKAIEVYLKYGLVSKFTATLMIGQNPSVEKARMDLERESDLIKKEDEFRRLNTGQPFEEPGEPGEPGEAGLGRQPSGTGLGTGGECVCPDCGATVPHVTGKPCYDLKCPDCGAKMGRVEEGEYVDEVAGGGKAVGLGRLGKLAFKRFRGKKIVSDGGDGKEGSRIKGADFVDSELGKVNVKSSVGYSLKKTKELFWRINTGDLAGADYVAAALYGKKRASVLYWWIRPVNMLDKNKESISIGKKDLKLKAGSNVDIIKKK